MTDFEKRVLERIAAQKLAPKSAYLFLARRSVFWALAAVSIFLGGISWAILFFIGADYFATSWRVLDNIQFNEALASIPALWLLLMGLFTASAAYGLRHTRRGYRFTAGRIVIFAAVAGIAIGGLLHGLRAGQALHGWLAATFPAYHAFTYVPFAEWSRPDEGFLGGTVIEDLGGGKIRLLDFHDRKWLVDVSAAEIGLDSSLLAEGDISITGERTGEDTFRARTIMEFN